MSLSVLDPKPGVSGPWACVVISCAVHHVSSGLRVFTGTVLHPLGHVQQEGCSGSLYATGLQLIPLCGRVGGRKIGSL